MRTTRTPALAVRILLLALLTTGSIAAADEISDFYDGKQVRLLIGYSAGGGYDTYARLLARHLGRHIPGNPTVVPQNIGALLELLLELSIECGEAITTEETRQYLESFKGSSKAAKAAKALLALEERNPAEARKAAALIALEARIERAERWQAMDDATSSRHA